MGGWYSIGLCMQVCFSLFIIVLLKLICYVGAFLVTSVMYVFVLPAASEGSYYVLRLIIHPLIMGMLTTTAKVCFVTLWSVELYIN